MILSCSECHARFLVPDSAIGASGRTVRCGKCKHTWFCPAPANFSADDEGVSSSPDIDQLMRDGKIDTRRKSKRGTADDEDFDEQANLPVASLGRMPRWMKMTSAALTITGLFLSALAIAPSMLGFESSAGLSLSDVRIDREPASRAQQVGNVQRVSVTGNLINNTRDNITAPQMYISVLDKEGETLRRWRIRQEHEFIAGGEEIPFTVSNIDVPKDEGTELRVEIGSWLEMQMRTED